MTPETPASEVLQKEYSDLRTLALLGQLQMPDYKTLKEIHGEDGLQRMMPLIKLFNALATQEWEGAFLFLMDSEISPVQIALTGGGEDGTGISSQNSNFQSLNARLPDDGLVCLVTRTDESGLDLQCISEYQRSPGYALQSGEEMYRVVMSV